MKITIPTRLNEITLKQWLDFSRVIKEETSDKDFIYMATVAIYCKMSTLEVRQMPYNEVKQIAEQILGLFEKDIRLIERFIMGGVEYGFIPNIDEITAGEMIDLDNSIKEVDLFPQFLAVAYRPVIKKKKEFYQIEEYKELTGEDILKMYDAPVSAFLGAQVFFYSLCKDLLNAIPDYMNKQKAQGKVKISEQDLQKVGDGINQFTQSLMAAY